MPTTTASAALPNERKVLITRVLDAPRSLVFTLWTDPQHMAQWWGPHGFTNPICEMDVRVGGGLRIVMRAPDGVDYPMTGTFRESRSRRTRRVTPCWKRSPPSPSRSMAAKRD